MIFLKIILSIFYRTDKMDWEKGENVLNVSPTPETHLYIYMHTTIVSTLIINVLRCEILVSIAAD